MLMVLPFPSSSSLCRQFLSFEKPSKCSSLYKGSSNESSPMLRNLLTASARQHYPTRTRVPGLESSSLNPSGLENLRVSFELHAIQEVFGFTLYKTSGHAGACTIFAF